MSRKRRGYTLMELVVVVIIIGVLAAVGIPQYRKSVEASRADSAVSVAHMIYVSNKMFLMDNPGSKTFGLLSTTQCNQGTVCRTDGNVTGCNLVRCSYLAPQEWDGAYSFYVCNGGRGGGCCTKDSTWLSCAERRDGAYQGWGYGFSSSGICVPFGGAPACPRI